MVENKRIKKLNKFEIRKNKYGIYWMQASQRVCFNHALYHAIYLANQFNIPLYVVFGVTDRYLNADVRHYVFMLEGIKEIFQILNQKGIKTIIEIVKYPYESVIKYSKNASFVVTDVGYTRIQREWREKLAQKINCVLYQVESDVIVPVEVVSKKEEFGAYTIRSKIQKNIPEFLTFHTDIPKIKNKILQKNILYDFEKILKKLKLKKQVMETKKFTGGYSQAKKILKKFLDEKLENYTKLKNDPTVDFQSNLSPYIHFGQISTHEIALEVLKAGVNINHAFLDELIIRRELAINFVYYNKDYDNFNCLPAWTKKTLLDHEFDKRQYNYNIKQLENGETHDIYWNTAQKELVKTGKMHGYMRMYWGKKVIEWTKSLMDAYDILVYLNDKYELDGRDPNGYAGIAWCFGKHDRPWREINIFGKVRYMSENGLKTKFNMDKYIERVNNE